MFSILIFFLNLYFQGLNYYICFPVKDVKLQELTSFSQQYYFVSHRLYVVSFFSFLSERNQTPRVCLPFTVTIIVFALKLATVIWEISKGKQARKEWLNSTNSRIMFNTWQILMLALRLILLSILQLKYKVVCGVVRP